MKNCVKGIKTSRIGRAHSLLHDTEQLPEEEENERKRGEDGPDRSLLTLLITTRKIDDGPAHSLLATNDELSVQGRLAKYVPISQKYHEQVENTTGLFSPK